VVRGGALAAGRPGGGAAGGVRRPGGADPLLPAHLDSAAFYLGRDDLTSNRSKFVHLLIATC